MKPSPSPERRRLPVYALRKRLLREIADNDTLIVMGETGSGKSTQIPQFALEVVEGGVFVTQPRRVAAITVASRVAQEMGCEVGGTVGYAVRFEDVTSPSTRLKYATDGLMLREAAADPLLGAYSVAVVDEAHERGLATDLLLGVLKRAQRERRAAGAPALKILLMSATVDADAFSEYLDRCPVLYVEGRAHPVTVFHTKRDAPDHEHTALRALFQIHREAPVDQGLLVFLTGREEIESLAHAVRDIAKETQHGVRVFPLYAGLPPAQQLEAWRPAPSGVRKVVLATNVAETSVTVPGVRHVVDTGLVKIRRHCPATGAEFLRVERCSKAACWQRTGRAGREAPGRCYRLFTARRFGDLPAHADPEMLRCPLASTVLRLLALRVDPAEFDFLDRPPEEALKGATELLRRLGAVTGVRGASLTPLGERMSAFPVDPKLAKVLLSAPEFDCLEEALTAVALLSAEGIFVCPAGKREEAAAARAKFVSPLGDHPTLLNAYAAFRDAPLKKQFCRDNFLNLRNLAYARNVREQLLDLCVRHGLRPSSCGRNTDRLLKCLLAGLFVNTARARDGSGVDGPGGYVTASGVVAAVHPSSTLHGVSPPPPCVLYTELVTTQRTFVSCVSAIEVDWLFQIAPEFARKCRTFR